MARTGKKQQEKNRRVEKKQFDCKKKQTKKAIVARNEKNFAAEGASENWEQGVQM